MILPPKAVTGECGHVTARFDDGRQFCMTPGCAGGFVGESVSVVCVNEHLLMRVRLGDGSYTFTHAAYDRGRCLPAVLR